MALLRFGQRVENQTPHLVDMSGSGGPDLVPTLIGECGQGVAAVGGVGASTYPATCFQRRLTTFDSRESVLPAW